MKLVALIVFLLLLAASGYGVHAVWATDMARAGGDGIGAGIVLLFHVLVGVIVSSIYLTDEKNN